MSIIAVVIDGHTFEVEVPLDRALESESSVRVDGTWVRVTVPTASASGGSLPWIVVDNRPYDLVLDPALHWIKAYGGVHAVSGRELSTQAPPVRGNGQIKAPIPGRITRVLACAGDYVQAGQPLLVLEAMKMENHICAPRDGRLLAVRVAEGQDVAKDALLAEVG